MPHVFEFLSTKHQTARGSLPDARVSNKMFLFKRSSQLHLTYQIRLLTYIAVRDRMKLVIEVPRACQISRALRLHVTAHNKYVIIQTIK
jgi:hypothetical protein